MATDEELAELQAALAKMAHERTKRTGAAGARPGSMEAEAEEGQVPAEVLRAVFAHAGAALGGRGAASAARVSRAWRAAAGPHGVVRAALGSEDADERVAGCKAVATAAAGEGEDEREAASTDLKYTFHACLLYTSPSPRDS